MRWPQGDASLAKPKKWTSSCFYISGFTRWATNLGDIRQRQGSRDTCLRGVSGSNLKDGCCS